MLKKKFGFAARELTQDVNPLAQPSLFFILYLFFSFGMGRRRSNEGKSIGNRRGKRKKKGYILTTIFLLSHEKKNDYNFFSGRKNT